MARRLFLCIIKPVNISHSTTTEIFYICTLLPVRSLWHKYETFFHMNNVKNVACHFHFKIILWSLMDTVYRFSLGWPTTLILLYQDCVPKHCTLPANSVNYWMKKWVHNAKPGKQLTESAWVGNYQGLKKEIVKIWCKRDGLKSAAGDK